MILAVPSHAKIRAFVCQRATIGSLVTAQVQNTADRHVKFVRNYSKVTTIVKLYPCYSLAVNSLNYKVDHI